MDFDNWAKATRAKLVRLAAAQLRDEHEAEDVVQETLVTLWRRGPDGITNLDAYAARAAWLNAQRRKQRHKATLPLDAELLRSAGFDEPTTRRVIEDEIRTWDIERAISALSDREQTVVKLHFYSGLSFREIGNALKISLNTAASRCRYAVNELRHVLAVYKKE